MANEKPIAPEEKVPEEAAKASIELAVWTPSVSRPPLGRVKGIIECYIESGEWIPLLLICIL